MLSVAKEDHYGTPELRSLYRPYLFRGLVLSLLLHVCLVSIDRISRFLLTPETKKGRVFIINYADLGPPPSIQKDILYGAPSAKFSFKDFSYGVPVPVPDIELKEDKPFPTVDQLSETGITAGNGSAGGISIPDSVQVSSLGDDLEGITPDTFPVLLKIAVPLYPESALQKKISGTVWVDVLVDERGSVKSAKTLKSDAEELNQAALDAAKKYTFTPGIYRNKRIPVWVSIPIRFNLEGN